MGIIHAGALAVGKDNVGASIRLQDVPAGGKAAHMLQASGVGGYMGLRQLAGRQAAARTGAAAAAAGMPGPRKAHAPTQATPRACSLLLLVHNLAGELIRIV